MHRDIADRVRQFVCEFWYENPHRLRFQTPVGGPGMTGNDAAEFLEDNPRRSRLT